MKRFINKATDVVLKFDEKGNPVKALLSDLILLSINQAPQEGFNVSEMRKRLAVAESIDVKALEEIHLSKESLDLVKKCFGEYGFGILSKEIVEIEDMLNSL